MATFLVFMALQFGDALTTLLFLRHGIAEANPLIRFAFGFSGSPAAGLVAAKVAACGLGVVAWRLRRRRLLRRANWFFAACAAWNLAAIALGG